jgi:hypothetical protein
MANEEGAVVRGRASKTVLAALNFSAMLKAQVLTLLNLSFSIPKIYRILNIPERTIRRFRATLLARRWEEKSTDPFKRQILDPWEDIVE